MFGAPQVNIYDEDIGVAGGFYCDQLGFTEKFRAPALAPAAAHPAGGASFQAAARSASPVGSPG
jgi:hypothetical protein